MLLKRHDIRLGLGRWAQRKLCSLCVCVFVVFHRFALNRNTCLCCYVLYVVLIWLYLSFLLGPARNFYLNAEVKRGEPARTLRIPSFDAETKNTGRACGDVARALFPRRTRHPQRLCSPCRRGPLPRPQGGAPFDISIITVDIILTYSYVATSQPNSIYYVISINCYKHTQKSLKRRI